MSPNIKREGLINLSLFLGIIAIDQLIKHFTNEGCFSIFCIRTVLNEGASFGIFNGMTSLFIVTASMVLVLMAYFYNKVDFRTKRAFTFIAAGTLGNLIDRIVFGGVIDKFAIWRSSAFNIADLSNVIGGIILILVIFSSKKKHKRLK